MNDRIALALTSSLNTRLLRCGLGAVLWFVSGTLPAANVDAMQLADALLPLIERHQGDVAVAVRVFNSQDQMVCQWNHQGERIMPTASLIKLPLMIEAYRQADCGELSLDDRVELAEADKVPGSGILTDHFSAGASFALRDAIRLMIRYSDNTATNLVIDRVGLPDTARTMAGWGLPETQLHSKVYRRETSIAPERSEQYGLGSTTANDMVELLTRLERRELVSEMASEEMLEHLLSCDDDTKMGQLLPEGCKLAHKTGAVNRSRTDAGIVYFDGGKFVLCVLTTNNEDTSWSDDNAAHLLCARIASTVYEQVARVATTAGSAKPMAIGQTGPLVEALQRTLNDRIDAELSVDGDFGPATAAAVKQFQSAHHIDSTGVVDAATWQALGDLLTEAEPVPAPDVINAQRPTPSPPLDPLAPPQVSAKAWVIADAETGKPVAELNSNEKLNNASTTKIMTAYLVLELASQDPKILNEVVTFSQRADDTIGSTSAIRAGELVPVGELLYGLLLPSGNDAAVAFAEHFGSRFDAGANSADSAYAAFVEAMNAKAEMLGMTNTRYANPHGLTAEDHYSLAADLAVLAAAALRQPGLREIVNCPQRGCQLSSVDGYTRNILWKNTNRLLGQEGFVGMKTGTTSAAGACLIAIGTRAEREHIVVLLGSSSSDARYIDARNLFAWAWRQ